MVMVERLEQTGCNKGDLRRASYFLILINPLTKKRGQGSSAMILFTSDKEVQQ